MNKKWQIILFLSSILVCSSVFAKSELYNPVQSNTFIRNLNSTLKKVQKVAEMPAIFPTIIPRDAGHTQYFSGYDQDNTAPRKGYFIYVDYTADCHGAHYCSVGYLWAQANEKPETTSYDLNHRNIIEPVSLVQHVQGYYTPGHAMGSYFPAALQWRDKGVLYTLSWDDHAADKSAMIAMANSAISAARVD